MRSWAVIVFAALIWAPAYAADLLVGGMHLSPEDGIISDVGTDKAFGQLGITIQVVEEFATPGTWTLSVVRSTGVPEALAGGEINADDIGEPIKLYYSIGTNSTRYYFAGKDFGGAKNDYSGYTISLKVEQFAAQSTDASASETDTTATYSGTVYVDNKAPEAPLNLAAEPSNGSVIVHFNEAFGSATLPTDLEHNIEVYRLYYLRGDLATHLITNETSGPTPFKDEFLASITGISSEDFSMKAGLDHYRVEGLKNGVSYSFVLLTVDHAGNTNGVRVDDDGPLVAYATPDTFYSSGEMSDLKDRCFIVTASLGDDKSPALWPYRTFRDYVLLSTPVGERLVRWYYAHGPIWASWLESQSFVVRRVAWIIAWAGAIALVLTPLILLVFVTRLGRKYWLSTLTLVWFAMWMPSSAFAEHEWRPDDETRVMRQYVRLSLSGYKPDIQFTHPKLGTNYSFSDLYGSKPTVLTRFGYGWEFYRFVGIFSVVGDVGLWTQKGKTLDSSGRLRDGDDRDRLLLMPVSAGLQYALQYVFPQFLVPAIESGVSIWGIKSTPPGTDVEAIQDFRYGWYWQGELRLLLDWIDPPTSGQFRFDFGVVDTHLVFGWREDVVTNFGKIKKGFDLSNRTMYGSLLFQF